MNPPDRYAVLGHPVAHSQSPWIHTEFARQTGQNLHYGRIDCPLDAFEATVRAFEAGHDPDGALGPARGCNVTVPFKFQVLALAHEVSARAALAGAANTLRFDAGRWLADNTDGAGLVRDLQTHAGVDLRDRRILLIGAGGAASGVLGPLLEARPRLIQVVNRTAERAHELIRRHATLAQRHGVELRAGGLDEADTAFAIVLNSSASSLAGASVPVSARVLATHALAVDLMYGAAARPFVDWAAAHGALGRDGLGMLVEQAAESFRLWRGVAVQTAPVLAALRHRLERA